MANFPSFLTTGPTVDIQTQPVARRALNLAPLIQSLQSAPKAKAPTAATLPEFDDSWKGTTGQTTQQQRHYDATMNQLNAGMNFYGAELFVSMPEYKGLVNKLEDVVSVARKNQLANNKEKLDSYDQLIKEKGASADIHLGMGLKTGIYMSHADWQDYMQNAETAGLGDTDPMAKLWQENFEFAPSIVRMKDAQAEVRAYLDAAGESSFADGSAYETIEEKAMGNMLGALQTYNEQFIQVSSNYNKHGEGTGRIGSGQLYDAKLAAWQRASSMIDMTDDITQGYWQGFSQRTLGMAPGKRMRDASGRLIRGRHKEAFNNRFNEKRSKEDNELLDKTHDGYYFKDGERAGQLDVELMHSDYQQFVKQDLDQHMELRKKDLKEKKTKQTLTYTEANEEAYKAYGNKKVVENQLQAMQQYDVTTAVTESQGFTEAEIANLVKDETGATTDPMAALVQNVMGMTKAIATNTVYDPGMTNTETMDFLTTQGSASPLIAKRGSNGEIMYTANPEFDSEEYRKYMTDQYAKTMTFEEAYDKAQEDIYTISKVHNSILNKRYSDGHYGDTRQNMKVYQITADGIAPELLEQLDKTLLGFKDAAGNALYRTAEEYMVGMDIQVGETVAEGASFLGKAKIVDHVGDLTLRSNVIARNQGVVAKEDVKIGGRVYKSGAFIPLGVFDALDDQAMSYLGSKIITGNTYWNLDSNGRPIVQYNEQGQIKGALPDRTGGLTNMGKNSEAISMRVATTGPNAPRTSPVQYYRDFKVESNVNEQLQHWEKTGATIKVEAPSYTEKADGQKYLNEAKNLIGNTKNPEEAADRLGLKGKTRTDFIAEASKVAPLAVGTIGGPATHVKALSTEQQITTVAGKYLAVQKEVVGARNWNVAPTIINKPIVQNGQIIPEAKQQLGWSTKGNTATFYVKSNVTQALVQTEQGRMFVDGSIDKARLNMEQSNKQQGKSGEGATDPSAAVRTVLGTTKAQPLR